jgi:hypothetical protein
LRGGVIIFAWRRSGQYGFSVLTREGVSYPLRCASDAERSDWANAVRKTILQCYSKTQQKKRAQSIAVMSRRDNLSVRRTCRCRSRSRANVHLVDFRFGGSWQDESELPDIGAKTTRRVPLHHHCACLQEFLAQYAQPSLEAFAEKLSDKFGTLEKLLDDDATTDSELRSMGLSFYQVLGGVVGRWPGVSCTRGHARR